VVGKKERLVLFDGPAHRASELIAPKGRFLGIEEVAGIQAAVPQEFENASVDLVGSRLIDGCDHAAGRSAILCGVLIGQNTKLADGVDSEIDVQSAARAGIGIIVHHESIDEKDVSRGTSAGNGERLPVAPSG